MLTIEVKHYFLPFLANVASMHQVWGYPTSVIINHFPFTADKICFFNIFPQIYPFCNLAHSLISSFYILRILRCDLPLGHLLFFFCNDIPTMLITHLPFVLLSISFVIFNSAFLLSFSFTFTFKVKSYISIIY